MADADPAAALFNVSRQFPELVAVEGKVVLQNPKTGHKIKVKIEKPQRKFVQSLKSAFKTKVAAENPVHNQPAQYEELVPPEPSRAPLVPQSEGDLATYVKVGTQRAQSYYNIENRKLPAPPVPGPDPGTYYEPMPIIPELPKLPNVLGENDDGARNGVDNKQTYMNVDNKYVRDSNSESTDSGGSDGASGAKPSHELSKQIRGDDGMYDNVSWDDDIYYAVSESPDQLNSLGTTPDDDMYSMEFEAVYSEMSCLRDIVKKNREADHKGASLLVANPPDEGRKSPDYMIAYV